MTRLLSACISLSMLLQMACSGGSSPQDDATGSDQVSWDQVDADGTTGFDGDQPDLTSEDTPEELLSPGRPVVFAVISDIHIAGDREHWTTQKVRSILAGMPSLTPPPEFVAITGDLLDTLYVPRETGEGSRVDALLDLLDNSPVPVELVAGNHDFYADDFPTFTLTDDPRGREAFIEETYGIPPYRSEELGGVQFIYLESMNGELWNNSAGLTGSLGQNQLQWLDEVLSNGTPSVVFLHHPPSLILEIEGGLTLESVVAAHVENVLAVFAGHLHLWERSTIGGAPLFLTTWAHEAPPVFHHVRVDPTARTVEILNEDDIPYGEAVESSCDPEQHSPFSSLAPLAETIHELVFTASQADAGGFGMYLEEGLSYVSFALKVLEPDPSGLTLPLAITLGYYSGNEVGTLPPYVRSSLGIPCVPLQMLIENPCFQTQPVDMLVDLNQALPFGLPSDWKLRVWFKDLTLTGRLVTDDPAGIEEGLLTANIDINQTIEDVHTIIVEEYCRGAIASCPPGQDPYPACPAQPDATFFDAIPLSCDVSMLGIGMRGILLPLLQSAPDGLGSASASFYSYQPTISATSGAGKMHPDVFSGDEGANCEGVVP